jgi:hypothetical protein
MADGLFDGRQYRVYREFTASTVLKFVATKPFILTGQNLYVDAGAARVAVSIGGTEGGTFTTFGTLFGKNGTNVKPSGATVAAGGTITGGQEREVLRVNAGAGQGAVTSLLGDRVLPAGTYYMSITVTGTTSGVYSFEFENAN